MTPAAREWVSTVEAGEAVGKSDQTIVAWIQKGDVTTDEYRRIGRQYQVKLEAAIRVAATKPPPRGTRARRPLAPVAPVSVRDADEADRLRLAVKEAEHELAELAAERDRLRVDNAKLRDTAAYLNRALARWIGAE